jgi:hypothetical protein
MNVAVSLAVLIWTAMALRPGDTARRRLVGVAAVLGVAGVCGTALGAELPYALLFQGQPYRVLWILKVLQIPLGFWLIRRWAASAALSHRIVALGLLFYFALPVFLGVELLLPLFVLPILLIRAWALGEDLKTGNRWWRLAATSIVVAAFLWAGFKWLLLIVFRGELFDRMDALEYGQRFVDHLGPCFWLVAVTLVAGYVVRQRIAPAAVGATLAALAIVYQTTLFVLPNAPSYRAAHTRFGADVAFTREFLAARHASGAPLPTVYSDWGRIDYVWVDLHTKSYFDWAQVVGVLFSRQTAAEGRRRAELVGPFAIDRFREDAKFIPDEFKQALGRLFRTDFDCPAPSQEDVARLCREPGLDYLILKHEFPGLVTAGNGRVFIYECQAVRAALPPPERNAGRLAAAGPGDSKARALAAP